MRDANAEDRDDNGEALDGVAAFYVAHKSVVDRWARGTPTFDFRTGQPGKFNYTKAKIVDMIGFEAGGRSVTKS